MNTGQVRYIFRNFPLNSIHPYAQKAAEAAECAGEQGKYWEMHDLLFAGQEQWSGSADAIGAFKGMAGDLGLDQAQFDSCLDDGDYAAKVSANADQAVAAGMSSTPSFSIEDSTVSGALSFAAFQQEIDYHLYIARGGTIELDVAADSYRSLGLPDAPVVITEFADFQ